MLSTVIVTYNSERVIANCLAALPEPSEDFELIVIDNASTDETVSVVRRLRPDVRLRVMNSNVGFAVAVNLGLETARGDTFLLLNPDASIDESAVEGTLDVLRSNTDIGVAAPLVLERGGEFHTLAAGYSPTVWHMFTHMTGISRFNVRFRLVRGHYLVRNSVGKNQVLDVDWTSGGCMFVRASLWRELSGLSTRWFMYAEDIEFCLRVRKAGLRVVIDTHFGAHHAVGSSSGDNHSLTSALWLENLFDLFTSGLSRSWLESFAWKWIVVSGFFARGAVAFLLGVGRRKSSSRDMAPNARRFMVYARSLARLRARHGSGYLRGRSKDSARKTTENSVGRVDARFDWSD
ncbi:glycosyltransferase family 2 protein [Microbacterium sp. nov. GSS16]|uniref:glycosyltransferase family 2 protein n=1 Tax=Microbacterium sp. nov. GSS16 TaxID=3019890 RepID=UPI003FA5EB08